MAVTPQPAARLGSPHESSLERERFWTPATIITLLRTATSGILSFLAAQSGSMNLLLTGLAIYWVGDMADGACARRFDHETRIGAVLDIICDRFNASAFYLGLAWLRPEFALPVGIYVAEFMTVDTFNSLAFLAWPTRSPNYFYEVDLPVFRFNWSKIAKATNSAIFAVLLLITSWAWLGIVIAVAMWLFTEVSGSGV